MTHVGARGSNDLIGRDILQTMTWMVPDEYEQLDTRKNLVILAKAAVAPGARAKIGVCGV